MDNTPYFTLSSILSTSSGRQSFRGSICFCALRLNNVDGNACFSHAFLVLLSALAAFVTDFSADSLASSMSLKASETIDTSSC